MGGVAVAGAASGKPFFHGSVGADVPGGRVAAEAFIAAHDALAVGVNDGRAVAHGNGIHGAAEVLGARGDPALFKAGEFRALAESHSVAGANAVGAHPDLRAAVCGVCCVGFVKRACTARADYRCLGAENIKLAVAHAKASGSHAAAILHQQASGRHAVVNVRAAFKGFFSHDGLQLLAVDGYVPLAAIADFSIFVPQNGQAPAFEIVHAFVEFFGIGERQIFTQGAAAHLRAAPANEIFRRFALGDVGVDGVHTCGAGSRAHDIGFFHNDGFNLRVQPRGFGGHKAASVAAADNQKVGCDLNGFNVGHACGPKVDRMACFHTCHNFLSSEFFIYEIRNVSELICSRKARGRQDSIREYPEARTREP